MRAAPTISCLARCCSFAARRAAGRKTPNSKIMAVNKRNAVAKEKLPKASVGSRRAITALAIAARRPTTALETANSAA